MEPIIYYGMYLLMAFAVAIGFVLVVGGTLHLGVKRPDGFLIYMFVPMVIAIAIGTLASGRNLGFSEDMLPELAEGGGAVAKWVQRLTSLFLLAASVQQITTFALAKRQINTPRVLMAAFVGFWICSVALPAIFGTRPVFSHEYAYALVIGFAAMLTTEKGALRTIVWARNALIVFMGAGLLVLAVKKSMVLAPYLTGFIPGFKYRYYGLSSGPNAIGPLAVLTLICIWCSPFTQRWLQNFAWVVAAVTLVLAQSRTSWIAAVLCLVVLLFVQQKGKPKGLGLGLQHKEFTQSALLGVMILVVAAMFVLISGAFDAKVEKFFETRMGNDLLTLTGRTEIWAVAFREWQRSPVFGYGPAMWDPYHRFQIGYASAFHAHNQFVNVLAVSGVVGMISFLIYLLVLVKRLIPRYAAFGGLPAALVVLMAVRSVSEVPISLHSFGSESMFHVLLLMLVSAAPIQKARMSCVGQNSKKATQDFRLRDV
ncbi:O-antigen ligase family protein [Paucibacter sp. B2R-40]|uniref:O-antigen ligase family protein n=1 Tax=Paucibacter sp. B2R-40 TaxID=2893554 RepID=UPI0021E4230C|nr:O-antigen ligase family protein [Paucibacter sp. B2R-40]MCV2357159.1 O-antigen ligase family protein [Paucibacter sp. B2R-40]